MQMQIISVGSLIFTMVLAGCAQTSVDEHVCSLNCHAQLPKDEKYYKTTIVSKGPFTIVGHLFPSGLSLAITNTSRDSVLLYLPEVIFNHSVGYYFEDANTLRNMGYGTGMTDINYIQGKFKLLDGGNSKSCVSSQMYNTVILFAERKKYDIGELSIRMNIQYVEAKDFKKMNDGDDFVDMLGKNSLKIVLKYKFGN